MLPGIDTSHYTSVTQAQLNQMVRSRHLYFNYIKASEGATIKDAAFTNLWRMSRAAGLLCGAYHFFRPLTDVSQQVANFTAQCALVGRASALPPVVDLEWAVVNKVDQWSQLPAPQRVANIKMFLIAVEGTLNVKPIIYTAPSFWRDFIAPGASAEDTQFFGGYGLWVVDLRGTGTLPAPWTAATFVQTHFGESATTNDPYDRMDQDRFPGDLKPLLNLAPAFTIAKGAPYSPIVVDLQNTLRTKGFLQDDADGFYGAHTQQAVHDFQAASGLFANGIIDAQTWNKLL